MEQELAEEKVNKVDVKHFISLIRKYKEPTEISDLMFHELIDKIVVYESYLVWILVIINHREKQNKYF